MCDIDNQIIRLFPDAEIPDSTVNQMTIRNLNISDLRPSNRITTKVQNITIFDTCFQVQR